MQHVADNVFVVPILFSFLNIYIIDTGDGLAIVDTGVSAAHINRVEKAVTQLGFDMQAIKHILISHFHNDHTGGLAELQARTNARTYAHKLEAPIIRGDQPPIYADPAELSGLAGLMRRMLPSTLATAAVDVEINDGDVLDDVLPDLQVVALPGHSPGQVGFYMPDSRILIGGDVMGHFPWGLRMPFRAPAPDWEQAKESIRRVADINVMVLCLGHGTPVKGNADQAVEKLVQRINRRG